VKDETFVKAEPEEAVNMAMRKQSFEARRFPEGFSIERLALDRAAHVLEMYLVLLAGRDCGDRRWSDCGKSAKLARVTMLRAIQQWIPVSRDYEEMMDWPDFPIEEMEIAPAGYREKALAMDFETWIVDECRDLREQVRLATEWGSHIGMAAKRRDRRFVNLVIQRLSDDLKYLVKASSGYMSERQREKAVAKEIRQQKRSQS